MERYVGRQVVPDVSEDHTAFIFMLKQSKNTLLVQTDPKEEGTMLSRKVRNHLPNDTAFR